MKQEAFLVVNKRNRRAENGVDRLKLNKRRPIRVATWNVKSLLDEEIHESVISFTLHPERIVMVQLNTNMQKIKLIQMYPPTADKGETEIKHFYIQLGIVLRSIEK